MLLIQDRVDDGQQLPLTDLLKRVLDVSPNSEPTRTWRILEVHGYGLGVCHLDDELDLDDHLEIDCRTLISISEDPNQWFYDLRVLDNELGVEFGVVDSSYLFLDGNTELSRLLASSFQRITFAK